jgi:cellobiose phosphorylase
MQYGEFTPDGQAFRLRDPLPPRPWINYLGNRRLTAFISQNAGGLLWYREPQTRRLTRYHYTAAPGDQPGFYLYVRDRCSGALWNPHFAPCAAALDRYECRVRPGTTRFLAARDGVELDLTYAIPPTDDVMLWRVRVRNAGPAAARLQLASYQEYGLFEFMREIIGWCYLKNQFSLRYDAELRAIRYDYHVFEAPYAPRLLFGCTAETAGWECSRDAFVGRTGTLGAPAALTGAGELGDSDLPLGGHACAVLGVERELAPQEETELAYIFALGETWEQAGALLAAYREPGAVDRGIEATGAFWRERLDTFQAVTGDEEVDAFLNTWNGYNAAVACELCRSISTDHMGTDGLRFRDTAQDALAVSHFDPDFARRRLLQVLAQQTRDGGGCMSFYPDNPQPTTDEPHRSDNPVWPVYTAHALLCETGDLAALETSVPFRDGGAASLYDHLKAGLEHIYARRGPHGLPTLFDVDWNDGLALFADRDAETVMLGQQLVHACRLLGELATRTGRDEDAAWCARVVAELTERLNGEAVWDGAWYRRLILSSGQPRGSAQNAQGRIYLNPQSWAVISGVADARRARRCMDAAAAELDSEAGLQILDPPFRGFPEPEDPPLGSNPGIGENGGIFCHANTWAVIAECLLGRGDQAWTYYRRLLPPVVARRFGEEHYQREPYVYVSSIVGPVSDRFGEAGISWLTGTASWMYVAATQYILGVRPVLDGLRVAPCLPRSLSTLSLRRRFRGCVYEIEIDHQGRDAVRLTLDDEPVEGLVLPPVAAARCRVRCAC